MNFAPNLTKHINTRLSYLLYFNLKTSTHLGVFVHKLFEVLVLGYDGFADDVIIVDTHSWSERPSRCLR